MSNVATELKMRRRRKLRQDILKNWELYLFLLPAVVALFLFSYLPMYGVQIAFRDYKSFKGIWGSEWVGLKHFERFVGLDMFPRLLKNTIAISVYSLVAGFPLPILLALALNACQAHKFKRIVQTVSYAPHFISTVILVGMINLFFSPSSGVVATILQRLGLLQGNLNVLMNPNAFIHLYVWSGVWSSLGWNSIVYLSALSGVDTSLHEAATVDGASPFRQLISITLPSIAPTIITLFILNTGSILSIGFEKIYLMQNSINTPVSEVISTYVYKIGVLQFNYSYSTAVGLFNSVVNLIMLLVVNTLSDRVSKVSVL